MNKGGNWKGLFAGIFIGTVSAMILFGIVTNVYLNRFLNHHQIHPVVLIHGMEVHGLSHDEALKELEIYGEDKLKNKKLTFVHEDSRWTYSMNDIGVAFHYEKAIKEALSFGRKGSVLDQVRDIKKMRENPVLVSLDHGFDRNLLNNHIEVIAGEIDKKAVPASIRRSGDSFVITPDRSGLKVDIEATLLKAENVLKNLSQQDIELMVEDKVPYPTTADLEKISMVIGEFSTSFNAGDYGRTSNLRRGAESIDGTLLLPGDVFSFNETTGPRVASAGYMEAPVILRGELVPGIGGGICQVSTTLYNAVVRAEMEVVERSNHSLPVSYVPKGQDATVAFGAIDFRFKNTREEPVYLESFVSGNHMYVKIHGDKREDREILLYSQTTQVIEPSVEVRHDTTMYMDEVKVEREAKTGYRVVTYKIVRENGMEVSREEFSREYYRPVNGIKIQGTRERQPSFENQWLDPQLNESDIHHFREETNG